MNDIVFLDENINLFCVRITKNGKIRAYLEKQGTQIGPLDTMIAGHAKSLDNAYKSIVVKGGENVKGNLIRYMLNVINYETPNADTISAIKEVEELKKIQTKKPMLHLESF